MEVILLQNIRNLGKTGEVVKVKDGYGRNFLIRTGKALRADDENKIIFQKKKDEIEKKNLEDKKIAKNKLEKIKNKKINFKKETKENGDLFAAIKPKEVSTLLSEKFKEVISPSQIDLKQEIKKIGNYKLFINLHPEVVAELQVVVEKKQDR